MIEFKIDIAKELQCKGWDHKKIRDSKLIGQKTYYEMIKDKKVPGIRGINALCYMLGRQPGSIIRYIPDDLEEK